MVYAVPSATIGILPENDSSPNFHDTDSSPVGPLAAAL